MSPPSARAAIYGVSIAVLGLIISLTPFGTSLEENFGLHILFRMRGERTAPEEVMIITMDKDSAERLNLSGTPRKWPRSSNIIYPYAFGGMVYEGNNKSF